MHAAATRNEVMARFMESAPMKKIEREIAAEKQLKRQALLDELEQLRDERDAAFTAVEPRFKQAKRELQEAVNAVPRKQQELQHASRALQTAKGMHYGRIRELERLLGVSP